MKYKVEQLKTGIKSLELWAAVGVSKEERLAGNHIKVDIEVEYDFSAALKSDKLKDTLDYASLSKIVHEVCKEPASLLEHLAGRIIEGIFEKLDEANAVNIRIAKLNPAVGGHVREAFISLRAKR